MENLAQFPWPSFVITGITLWWLRLIIREYAEAKMGVPRKEFEREIKRLDVRLGRLAYQLAKLEQGEVR